MASLYEIDRQILECCDPETGEVIDPEMLDALLMKRETKIEGVACWIKNLESDAAAIKAEREALIKREVAALAKAEALREWLANALQGQKFSTARCAVSFRKSEAVVFEADFDVNAIQSQFQKRTETITPDKMAIKAALKAGEAVAGCRLVQNLNTLIK